MLDATPSNSSTPTSTDDAITRAIKLERAWIGTVLVNNDVIDSAPLDSTHMIDALHADVISVAQRLRTDGRPVTPATLAIHLSGHRPITKSMDAATYVANLVGDAVSPSQAVGIADLVRDAYARREAVRIMTQAMTAIANPRVPMATTVDQMISGADSLLLSGVAATKHGRYTHEAADSLIAKMGAEDAMGKVRTGFSDLEAHTGPWLPSANVVLSGATGSYKTTLACQIAINAASAGAFVAIISQEMLDEQVVARLLCSIAFAQGAKLTTHQIRSMDPGDEQGVRAVMMARDRLEKLGIHICDKPGMSISEVQAYVRRLEKKSGRKLDLLVIDYLGLLAAEGRYRGNKTAETAELSTEIKRLAMRSGLVTLTLHQLNRAWAARDNKRPRREDLKDSSQIEQDADAIIMTFREATQLEKDIDFLEGKGDAESMAASDEARRRLNDVMDMLEVGIEKARNGREGVAKLHVEPAHNYICMHARPSQGGA